MMKSTSAIVTGTLACAAAFSASAQENSTTTTPPKAGSLVRLEGTDLRIADLPPVTFHGFASQGFLYSSDFNYLDSNSKNGSFRFTELGLNASMNPFPNTRIAAQAFDFDVGSAGQYEPFLDYALVEYTFNSELGLRAGRVRRPGGIYNHIQDIDLARTSVLLPQGMYDARWRDFSTSVDGGEIFGDVPLSKAGSLSYEAFGGLVNLSDHGGVAHWIVNDSANATTLDYLSQPVAVGGQIWWNTPINGFRAGANLTHMNNMAYADSSPGGPSPFGPITGKLHTGGDVTFQQYSLEYLWKSWTFQAEYFRFRYDAQYQYQAIAAGHLLGALGGSSITEPGSWYASAAYRFNSWLETGVYYTEYYNDANHWNGGPGSYQKDLALSFRFDPKPWWIIKLEGHYINGTALLQDDAHNHNRDGRGWYLLAVKNTFSF